MFALVSIGIWTHNIQDIYKYYVEIACKVSCRCKDNVKSWYTQMKLSFLVIRNLILRWRCLYVCSRNLLYDSVHIWPTDRECSMMYYNVIHPARYFNEECLKFVHTDDVLLSISIRFTAPKFYNSIADIENSNRICIVFI